MARTIVTIPAHRIPTNTVVFPSFKEVYGVLYDVEICTYDAVEFKLDKTRYAFFVIFGGRRYSNCVAYATAAAARKAVIKTDLSLA